MSKEKKQTNWLKQSSWFKTEVDFENSFKFWFALQWQNGYMWRFLVVFAVMILEIIKFDWIKETIAENFADEGYIGAIFATCGFSIPPIVCLAIAYKAFYQYFNDLKHGRSR